MRCNSWQISNNQPISKHAQMNDQCTSWQRACWYSCRSCWIYSGVDPPKASSICLFSHAVWVDSTLTHTLSWLCLPVILGTLEHHPLPCASLETLICRPFVVYPRNCWWFRYEIPSFLGMFGGYPSSFLHPLWIMNLLIICASAVGTVLLRHVSYSGKWQGSAQASYSCFSLD